MYVYTKAIFFSNQSPNLDQPCLIESLDHCWRLHNTSFIIVTQFLSNPALYVQPIFFCLKHCLSKVTDKEEGVLLVSWKFKLLLIRLVKGTSYSFNKLDNIPNSVGSLYSALIPDRSRRILLNLFYRLRTFFL